MIKCPKCNSSKFYYVCLTEELHHIEEIDESGNIDLLSLEEAFEREESKEFPYLWCCNCRLNIKVKEYIETYLKKTKVP